MVLWKASRSALFGRKGRTIVDGPDFDKSDLLPVIAQDAETGNVQEIQAVFFDCDADTLLIKVRQVGGAACHKGYRSCFFRQVDPATQAVQVVGERVFDPSEVYGK